MVVAHADDEALFGGDSLLLYGPWHLLWPAPRPSPETPRSGVGGSGWAIRRPSNRGATVSPITPRATLLSSSGCAALLAPSAQHNAMPLGRPPPGFSFSIPSPPHWDGSTDGTARSCAAWGWGRATCAEVQDARYAPSPYYYNHWRPAEFRRCGVAYGGEARRRAEGLGMTPSDYVLVIL